MGESGEVTTPRSRFEADYRAALVAYVEGPDEQGRSRAYDIGRRAVAAEMGLLELAGLHAQILRERPPGLDLSTPKAAVLATEFLAESLTTFDMAQRGYWEAQARARTESERRVKGERLAEAYVAVTSSRALDERLADIGEWAARLVGASRAEVDMVLTDEDDRAGDVGFEGADAGGATAPAPDAAGPDAIVLDIPGRFGRPVARLTVWTPPLSPTDADVLDRFAHMAGVAIENALVFERDHRLAVTLQRSLLPSDLLVPERLTVAVRYVPAGLDGEVGGDWYDVISLPDQRVALVVGDVVGHGIGQAAIMGQLRFALRAYAVEGHPPDQIAGRLDTLLRSLPDAPSATLLYVGIDLGSFGIEVLNAGHPPAVIVQPSRQARFLDVGRAGLLGVSTEAHRTVQGPFELTPGTLLLMYTDGLLESTERDGIDGFAALLDTLRDFDGDPEELCDIVMAKFVTGPPSDDVCLLSARVSVEAKVLGGDAQPG
jgi:Stage II sporulation protein E (SpoIIE)/Phosphoserine phosphatase RsbU, N-terminal domain